MNTGAILNRINFGLALAGGRLPTASVGHWTDEARLRTASREAQVDAVVGAFLGGHVSPDTREILVRGENPLAARLGAAHDSSALVGPSGTMQPRADTSMVDGTTAELMFGPRRPAPLARPVQLQGLAQVVGLAIGAPEFQRR
jgi:hypothetical protein